MKDYLTEIADLRAEIRRLTERAGQLVVLHTTQVQRLERELAEARLAIKNLASQPNRRPENMHFATCDDESCPGCFW